MRVLLVEDEVPIANVIRRGLEKAGFGVDTVHDGEAALVQSRDHAYSVIILDLMLPKLDGLSVCRALRARRDPTPILMLTARDAIPDRVTGLEAGADDYLPKPFDFQELLARVRAQVRREGRVRARTIKVRDVEIDTVGRRVTRGGAEVSLTPREYALLEALATHEGQVLTRDVILDRVWMDERNTVSNTVDVYINLLRRKIDAGADQRIIQTVHGVGYVLRRPEDEEEAAGGAEDAAEAAAAK